MLIFTRRGGEAVRIGNDISLLVDSVQDGKVRIGINAPPETRILREELRPASKSAAIGNSDVSHSNADGSR